MTEIKVYVFKKSGRKNYYCQWDDPVTGATETRSTGCDKRREAERWAGKLRAELEEGRYKESSRLSWADFRTRYEEEKDWQSDNTFKSWLATARHVERIIRPKRLATIDTNKIDRLTATLLDEGAAVDSIKGYLKYLRSALYWAKKRKLIHEVPHFEMPQGGDEARCRPITAEEYDRIINQVDKKRPRTAASWNFYLRGLWFSGLRLDESVRLSWDADAEFSIDMDGKYPMLRIRKGSQKNKKAELLPLAPEFCEMLQGVPEDQRTGHVFGLPNENGKPGRTFAHGITRAVRSLAKAANVKVADKNGKVKWATPHDFRRAFGSRWAKRVMPAVLMRLMRHKRMETTMNYYATQDAESVAQAAFEAVSSDYSSDSLDLPSAKPL